MNGESRHKKLASSDRNGASTSNQDPARQGAIRAFAAISKTSVKSVGSQLGRNASFTTAATAGKIASSRLHDSKVSEPKLRITRNNQTRNQSPDYPPAVLIKQSSSNPHSGRSSKSYPDVPNARSPHFQLSSQARSCLTSQCPGPDCAESKSQITSVPPSSCPLPKVTVIPLGETAQAQSKREDDRHQLGTFNTLNRDTVHLDNESMDSPSPYTHAKAFSTSDVVSTTTDSALSSTIQHGRVCAQPTPTFLPNQTATSMQNLMGWQDVTSAPTPQSAWITLERQEPKRAASDCMDLSTSRLGPIMPGRKLTNTSSFLTQQAMHATVNSMADAIVASSLATSRSAVSYKSTPYPRRGTNSLPDPLGFRLLSFEHVSDARSHSTAKSLRTTLRTTSDQEDAENRIFEGAKKRHLLGMRKHPNKHHEGDRKRWRNSVTEIERKRYEAVWASNRGIHSFDTDTVVNVVVKDIWSRSRLGSETLAELWDLVDKGGKGYLERGEFVAGLWLIDQRLKGRKLPMKLSESVWGSVGGLGGIKIKFG